MGSSISHFDIILDHEQGQHELLPLFAGSTVRGKIVVEITTPIRHYNNNNTNNDNNDAMLTLRLYGKEKVKMNPQQSKRINGERGSTSCNGKVSKVAEREFLSIPIHWNRFPLETDTPTIIPIGTYTFPFQIQLPNSIPSSIYYPPHHHDNSNDTGTNIFNNNRSRGQMNFRIQYKVQATLYLPKTATTTTKVDIATRGAPDHTTVRYLWVSAISDPDRIPVEPVPIMVEPIAMELRNAFFQKGIFMFGASIENTRLYLSPMDTDNTVALHVSCRNDSSIQIQKVHISIVEQLTWNTVPKQKINKRTGIASTSMSLQQTHHIPILITDNVQLPGLYRESKGLLKSVMEGMFGTTKQNLHRQVYQDLTSGQNLISLPVPTTKWSMLNTTTPIADGSYHGRNNNNGGNTTIRESYRGQLIQISHYVKIVFQTGTFCKTPTLEIPIQILPNPVSTLELQLLSSSAAPSSSTSSVTCHNTATTTTSTTGAGSATYHPPISKSKIPSKLPFASTTTTAAAVSGSIGSSVNTGSTSTTTTTTNGEGSVEVSTTPPPSNPADENIPMATAVIVPTNGSSSINRYEAQEAVADIIVLGGDAIIPSQQQQPSHRLFNRRSSSRQQQQQSLAQQNAAVNPATYTANLSTLVPLSAPMKQIENSITIPGLISSMRSSMMDQYEYIQSKICEPEWIELFYTMSSHEYGSLIANVHEFDQPRIALLLAPFINHNHGGCNCDYAAAAIRHSATNHRAITAQKLIPLCYDIQLNHTIVLDELNGWEQTITESTLADAMKS